MGRGDSTKNDAAATPSRLERHHRRIAADVERARVAINELFDRRPEWKPREIQEEACVRAHVGRGAAAIAFNEMAADGGEVTIDENFIARRESAAVSASRLDPEPQGLRAEQDFALGRRDTDDEALALAGQAEATSPS